MKKTVGRITYRDREKLFLADFHLQIESFQNVNGQSENEFVVIKDSFFRFIFGEPILDQSSNNSGTGNGPFH